MKNLSIDTSSAICSVAILENDELIDEENLNGGKTHSENLMPLIDNLLKRNNIDIKDIELLSCCVGPGSFTGIRIGVATVKPIAEILKIKIASITSLEALARNVENRETIVSIIDAKNDEVYCGIFDKDYNLKQEYLSDNINKILDELKKYSNITVVGDGAICHKNLLINELENVEFVNNNFQSASSIGKLGYKKLLEKNLCSADNIVPLYLRKSQAERLKK